MRSLDGAIFVFVEPAMPGFMPLWGHVAGLADPVPLNIPCIADEFIPDDDLYLVEPHPGRVAVVAHPNHWGDCGARYFAAAFRPEGL